MLRFYQFLLMTAITATETKQGFRAFAIIFSEVMAEKAATMARVLLAPRKPEDPSQMAERSEYSVWIQVENCNPKCQPYYLGE